MTEREDVRGQIAKVAEILVRDGVATENTIRGCSATEIEEVQADVGRPLPLAYREFLAKMGRGAGDFYVGTDIFYPTLLGITEAAHELVAEDEAGIVLPKDAIAFMMHQGYQFMFVRTDEGDDPPVYYYMEISGEFVKKADKLTQFLIDVAQDEW
ncbi:SMI1/KNR4 family protein [Symmachiella dynata]|uniref:SMI1 / KNR4 family protein n=1 Tax=Symmachiella dynata TaxID=2527995 RepID=A0A517ZLW9_9PLAN|nr:SMI1/KNR4 family protein [Symmachiella dynata]QDU43509.1 SMI1 / KNR4 family protein [Symmachiella dynata]